MEIQDMKLHQLARGFWEHESPSLTLGCKRLRPLAPKLPGPESISATITTTANTSFNLKSFIRPESAPRTFGSSDSLKKESAQVEGQAGGTRWNPTQEQIGILEVLYRGGMRTPNAQQIEQITAQLGKYGKIEGKNVFYWFQNHKARERQKKKRTSLGLGHALARTPPSPFCTTSLLFSTPVKGEDLIDAMINKRQCTSWKFDCLEENYNSSSNDNNNCKEEDEEGEDRTLKLFPLHPEGIRY